MANKETKFELTKDLEELVKDVQKKEQLADMGESKPGLDQVDTRRIISRELGDLRYLNLTAPEFVEDLRAVSQLSYEALNTRLDDKTYNEGRAFYTAKLDKEVQAGMYGKLMLDGIVPEKPSKELSEVIQKLELAEQVEKDLAKGDRKTARARVSKYMSQALGLRLAINDLHSGAAYDRFLESAIEDIANAQKLQAYAKLSEGKLYKEIDSAIEKAQYGKAKAFTSAYQAYGTQQKVNEEKAKAAEAEKKKGK